MGNISKTLADALAYDQAGELAPAARIYRQLLHDDPNHADALHYLGVLTSQRGNFQAAIQLLSQASVINPRNMHCHYNLGRVFHLRGQLSDAVDCY